MEPEGPSCASGLVVAVMLALALHLAVESYNYSEPLDTSISEFAEDIVVTAVYLLAVSFLLTGPFYLITFLILLGTLPLAYAIARILSGLLRMEGVSMGAGTFILVLVAAVIAGYHFWVNGTLLLSTARAVRRRTLRLVFGASGAAYLALFAAAAAAPFYLLALSASHTHPNGIRLDLPMVAVIVLVAVGRLGFAVAGMVAGGLVDRVWSLLYLNSALIALSLALDLRPVVVSALHGGEAVLLPFLVLYEDGILLVKVKLFLALSRVAWYLPTMLGTCYEVKGDLVVERVTSPESRGAGSTRLFNH